MSESESSLYSRHSQNYAESVSVEICSILTRLGYGEEIRRWRIKKYREFDRLVNARRPDVTMITAGSKAEGLTCRLESDWDILQVLNKVLCVEAGTNLRTIPCDMEVYRMDTCAYPGHCKLFLERQALGYYNELHRALYDNGNGDVLLSSDFFVEGISILSILPLACKQAGMVQNSRAGPSIPLTIHEILHMDNVVSLPCHCPSILKRWAARHRHWPPPIVVEKVVSLGAYLTPVGYKGSESKHVEWRVCFNTGEAELVDNLNDTQAKVYVMLKMILKNVLRPSKKEITSYVMKNIVLWQAENNQQNRFYAGSLFYWLHDGLKKLRTAIVTQQLSYYMIPERNLMAASGLQDKQQRKWVADITDMIAEGPNVILRLPKIRKAIVASPEPMLWFSKRRMELEMLWMEYFERAMHCHDENGEPDECDYIIYKIKRRQAKVLLEVWGWMVLDGCIVNDLMIIYDRILM